MKILESYNDAKMTEAKLDKIIELAKSFDYKMDESANSVDYFRLKPKMPYGFVITYGKQPGMVMPTIEIGGVVNSDLDNIKTVVDRLYKAIHLADKVKSTIHEELTEEVLHVRKDMYDRCVEDVLDYLSGQDWDIEDIAHDFNNGRFTFRCSLFSADAVVNSQIVKVEQDINHIVNSRLATNKINVELSFGNSRNKFQDNLYVGSLYINAE